MLTQSWMQFCSSSVHAFTVLHPFIFSPSRLPTPTAASTHLQSTGWWKYPRSAEEAVRLSAFPRIQRLSCLLDSHLAPWPGEEWCVCLGGCRYAVVQPLPSNVGWDEAPVYETISQLHWSAETPAPLSAPWENSFWGSRKQAGCVFSPAMASQKLSHLPEMWKQRWNFQYKVAPRDSDTCSNFLASRLERRCAQGWCLC